VFAEGDLVFAESDTKGGGDTKSGWGLMVRSGGLCSTFGDPEGSSGPLFIIYAIPI
jgi:hypothetical protein